MAQAPTSSTTTTDATNPPLPPDTISVTFTTDEAHAIGFLAGNAGADPVAWINARIHEACAAYVERWRLRYPVDSTTP